MSKDWIPDHTGVDCLYYHWLAFFMQGIVFEHHANNLVFCEFRNFYGLHKSRWSTHCCLIHRAPSLVSFRSFVLVWCMEPRAQDFWVGLISSGMHNSLLLYDKHFSAIYLLSVDYPSPILPTWCPLYTGAARRRPSCPPSPPSNCPGIMNLHSMIQENYGNYGSLRARRKTCIACGRPSSPGQSCGISLLPTEKASSRTFLMTW